MLIQCEICKKYYPETFMKSLYSYSESGASIVTILCSICGNDEKTIEKIISQRDNDLEHLDKSIISA